MRINDTNGLLKVSNIMDDLLEEMDQLAAGPELGEGKELKNEATEEREEKELESDKDNKDVFPTDEHDQKEDVGEVVVKEALSDLKLMEILESNGYEPTADNLIRLKEGIENGTYVINEEDVDPDPNVEDAKDAGVVEPEDDKDSDEKKDEEKSDEKKDEIVDESLNNVLNLISQINESLSQTADGPELEGAKELDNEATEEKEPRTAEASTDNKDVYCDVMHKQVEDVVEVVVEAVAACKAKKKSANHKNICEEVEALLETKNFDIDAFIMSREMNGSKKFDEYEKLEGKGAKCGLTGLRESVKYGSLKEACMLDDGYFAEDSYVKETADEKISKLTEQVSLLMARDAMDPLYDELLKESAYCMRLREQLQNKYARAASNKVDIITEAATKNYKEK